MHPRWGARATRVGRTPSSSCQTRPSLWTSNSSSCRSTESLCHLESVHCGGASSARCAAGLRPLYMAYLEKLMEFHKFIMFSQYILSSRMMGCACMHMSLAWFVATAAAFACVRSGFNVIMHNAGKTRGSAHRRAATEHDSHCGQAPCRQNLSWHTSHCHWHLQHIPGAVRWLEAISLA